MTDEQIIKALEDLLKNFDGKVVDFMAISSAIDLINRQKADLLHLRNKVELLEQDKKMSKEDSDKSKAAAMEVIKKQEAEIERLKKQVSNNHDVMMNIVKANGG